MSRCVAVLRFCPEKSKCISLVKIERMEPRANSVNVPGAALEEFVFGKSSSDVLTNRMGEFCGLVIDFVAQCRVVVNMNRGYGKRAR
jgi:hypothetical protein